MASNFAGSLWCDQELALGRPVPKEFRTLKTKEGEKNIFPSFFSDEVASEGFNLGVNQEKVEEIPRSLSSRRRHNSSPTVVGVLPTSRLSFLTKETLCVEVK